jgi:pimeloyl-ACP methyl ester carboxylesterase
VKTLIAAAALFVCIGTAHADDASKPVPLSVITDPAPDPSHPPRSAQVLVPSHGVGMNALFYLAGGAGPHPTMVLLHGIPGNEQNLDLAQAVRRAGWNVLTLHYRGSWGSPGTFSIAHALEDADAAVEFVRRKDIAEKFGIDTRRIVLGGHSMGALASAAHARHDRELQGVVLLDAWNAGTTGDQMGTIAKGELAAASAKRFDDFGNSLQGATPASVAAETIAHHADWNYQSWAQELIHEPLLIVGASRGRGEDNRKLAQAVIAAGGNVTAVTLDTDHSFQDQRIALAALLVDWLQKLPAEKR